MTYQFRQIIDLEEVPVDFAAVSIYVRDKPTGFVVEQHIDMEDGTKQPHELLMEAYVQAQGLMKLATSFDPEPGDVVVVAPEYRRYVAIMKGPGFAGGDRYLDWAQLDDSAGHMNPSAMRSAWMEGRVAFARRMG